MHLLPLTATHRASHFPRQRETLRKLRVVGGSLGQRFLPPQPSWLAPPQRVLCPNLSNWKSFLHHSAFLLPPSSFYPHAPPHTMAEEKAQDAWIRIQEKTFTRWMNTYVRKRSAKNDWEITPRCKCVVLLLCGGSVGRSSWPRECVAARRGPYHHHHHHHHHHPHPHQSAVILFLIRRGFSSQSSSSPLPHHP